MVISAHLSKEGSKCQFLGLISQLGGDLRGPKGSGAAAGPQPPLPARPLPAAPQPCSRSPLSRQRSQLAQLLFTKGFVSSTLCFFTREAQCFLLKRRVRNKRGKEDITALVFHNAAMCWLEFYFR